MNETYSSRTADTRANKGATRSSKTFAFSETVTSESFILNSYKRKKDDVSFSTYNTKGNVSQYGQAIIETSSSTPALPPHGTIVNLSCKDNSKLLAAKWTQSKWRLQYVDTCYSSFPQTQFVIVRSEKYIGFRSAVADGCLLQVNKRGELGFVNPRFELWERWETWQNGFRNAKFKDIVICIDIMTYPYYSKETVHPNVASTSSLNGISKRDEIIGKDSEEQTVTQDSQNSTKYLMQDRDILCRKLNERDICIQQLEDRLEKLEKSYQRLSLDHANCLENLREAKKTIQSLENSKKSVMEQIPDKLNLIAYLEEKCSAEGEYKKELMRRVEEKEYRIKELEGNVRDLRDVLNSKERLLAATQKNLRSLRESLSHSHSYSINQREVLVDSTCRSDGSNLLETTSNKESSLST
ncbi:hypothetical protein Gasu2_19120 [Galdieria sulphuraria]|uniref:Uncharacterized protein n=1 Tax=Galdieria sulphuraria TaxID=130081 RepID=M2WTI7_GALSU|nr:uncharacterized protein Gasu_51960 [Galdieria sulphuraria]EME27215.1 hypothetical protein Gasu_51960 [Galdieria sulphuraria]GJD07559.1 hypothetical protein Gasu2_19120 [Galdieria sulphuraria]|eukprot:XP_005703735.1 hypothetical protein Gasu_51960 [Galdieria sulphuraria]